MHKNILSYIGKILHLLFQTFLLFIFLLNTHGDSNNLLIVEHTVCLRNRCKFRPLFTEIINFCCSRFQMLFLILIVDNSLCTQELMGFWHSKLKWITEFSKLSLGKLRLAILTNLMVLLWYFYGTWLRKNRQIFFKKLSICVLQKNKLIN